MGPLKGLKVVEVGGIGPGPFCAQMLADMGADVIRLERGGPRGLVEPKYDVWHRGRKSVVMDLRKPEAAAAVLKLVEQADALIEGFRPGVMERLGLGPADCFKHNPKLIYGRMTGWGQDGPLAQTAGHDINYISLSGVLHAIGSAGGKPVPPLNLVGDLGGGGMLLAFGIVCGVLEARTSGKGQVIDASMVDGSAALMGVFYGLKAAGFWSDQRGTNLLDGGAHFYDTYETKDGRHISIGSIEPQFYELLLEKARIDDPDFKNQLDFTKWPELKDKLTQIIKSRTRDEWCEIMEGSDVCFAPVLSMEEAIEHPHNVARQTFVQVGETVQPAPAPRFSRTKPDPPSPAAVPGEHTREALRDWAFSDEEIEKLLTTGAISGKG